jgi:type I restriction enzyme S subunit
VLGQNLVILRSRGTKVDQGFLRWLTRSPAWWQQIEKNLNVGAVFDSLRCADIPGFELAFPPLGEQRTIASFLGALDDKIELNRQMNETLEAMTQALFKSWFVDFDPVRAKAEGRDPGLPQPLTDLFPARLVDSELGEIPEGWEVGRLGDVLCQRVERCIASAETVARPYVPIECISSKSLFLADSKPGEEAQSSLTKFYKDDLLFGAMRPYFHKVCIAPFDGTTRTTVFVLYPRRKDDFAFATLLLHDSETIDFATRHSTGSTIPYAVWVDSMDGMPTVLPPSDVRAAFDHAVRPVLARIPRPYFESRTLADLRDTLLPKLISGELRISNEERATIREA